MAGQLGEGLTAYFRYSEINGHRATIRQMVQVVKNGKKFLQSRKRRGCFATSRRSVIPSRRKMQR